MPRPPEPGCYVITRRDGLAIIVMYVDAGRLVEMLGPIQTARRPRRRTTRYLGETWGAVVQGAERRRRERLLLAAYGAIESSQRS
jgi:hypothetical protein